MEIGNYNFEEHLHRYAIWTAARAIQRGYKSTEEIQKIINTAKLQKELGALKDHLSNGREYFDWHNSMCNSLMSIENSLSFGRASKLIAIYLKTSEIIPSRGESELAIHAYAPIDGILLKNANTCLKEKIKKIDWTNWDENDYINVIKKLDSLRENMPWWKIEYLWEPVQKKKKVKEI